VASANHPQTHGLAERVIRSILTKMRIISLTKKDTNLSTISKEATFSHNCTINRSTGYSPFKIIYFIFPTSVFGPEIQINMSSHEFTEKILHNTLRSRDKMHIQESKRRGPPTKSYSIGDEILLTTCYRKPNGPDKL
jgi:hypothetical protein